MTAQPDDLAVIFDMDGVIADSTPFHKKAWQRFCEKYNFDLEEKDFENIYGRTNKDTLTYLFGEDFNEEEIEKYTQEKEQLYRSIYKEHLEPINGVINFLKELNRNNIKTAVATSAPINNVKFMIDGLNIRKYFDIIINEDSVKKGKPNPEIYLKAAELLDVSPSSCVVFEDSLSGVEAALRAEMKVIGVTTSHTEEELADADFAIDNFVDFGLERL